MSWDASDEDTWERWERQPRRDAPTLNRNGNCVACDQPLGHNPNRCCICATAYDKEHPA
jgi:hypothetical protein